MGYFVIMSVLSLFYGHTRNMGQKKVKSTEYTTKLVSLKCTTSFIFENFHIKI